MKQFLFALNWILIASQIVDAQSDTTSRYQDLKRVKYYRVGVLSQEVNNDRVSYFLDGEVINEERYNFYRTSVNNIKQCCPCILETVDVTGKLLTESISCQDCLVGWHKSYYPNGNLKVFGQYKENDSEDWTYIFARGYCSMAHGEWIFYNDNGSEKYREYYENGKFLKQIPEQEGSQLWEVELYLDGIKVDSQEIFASRVMDLKVRPKFKTSDTTALISLEFKVIGQYNISENLSLEQLKIIDIHSMIEKAGTFNQKTDFWLTILNDGKAFKSFYLKVVQ